MTSLCTRTVERDAMFLMADLVFADGYPEARVKVRNLSAGGMMVEGELRIKRGTRVVADLRNIGLIAGVVVWIRGTKFGIAFEDRIDPKQARREVFGGNREAPTYARAALDAPRHDGWNGKMRRI